MQRSEVIYLATRTRLEVFLRLSGGDKHALPHPSAVPQDPIPGSYCIEQWRLPRRFIEPSLSGLDCYCARAVVAVDLLQTKALLNRLWLQSRQKHHRHPSCEICTKWQWRGFQTTGRVNLMHDYPRPELERTSLGEKGYARPFALTSIGTSVFNRNSAVALHADC